MSLLILLGPETLVNTTTADSQALPSVVPLSGGGYVVAWQSVFQDGSSYGIYSQRYDVNGNPVGDETLVNTTTLNSQTDPAVVGLANGGYVVMWASYTAPASFPPPPGVPVIGSDVYAQLYDASGNEVGGEIRVNTTTASGQAEPAGAPCWTAAT